MFVLLFAVLSSRAAFPVFLGGTSDYITNSAPGTIVYVYSNQVRIISFRSPGGATVYTNGPVAIYAKPGQSVAPFSVFDTNGNRQFLVSSNQSGVMRLGTNANGWLTFSNNAANTNSTLQSGNNAPSIRITENGSVSINGTPVAGAALTVNGKIAGVYTGDGGFGDITFADSLNPIMAYDTSGNHFAMRNDGFFGWSVSSQPQVSRDTALFRVGPGIVGTTNFEATGNGLFHSNVVFTNLTLLAATNGSANTNITVNYDQAVRDIFLTNNASFTNHSGLAEGKSKSVTLFITPTAINRTIVWPTLGGPSFGTYWYTNSFSPLWTTLTSGVTYALSLTTRGTNVHASITDWK